MIRILHISDIHLTQSDSPLWGVDVRRNFDSAVASIAKIKDRIDAIFITGDLSNDGSIESYKYIDKAFRTIGIPTYCCMGNHDNQQNMESALSGGYIILDPIVRLANWKFIMLNSVVPDEEEIGKNKARGFLSNESLTFLESNLDDSNNIAIVLHHPPIEPGGWLNRKLLDNRTEFNDLIMRYPQVKLVLYGHTHYNQQIYYDDILYSSASSIGFAFDKDLPKFQISHGAEGYNIVSLGKDDISIDVRYLPSKKA